MIIPTLTLEEASAIESATEQMLERELKLHPKDRHASWYYLTPALEKLRAAKDPLEVLEMIGAIAVDPNGDLLNIIDLLRAHKYIV